MTLSVEDVLLVIAADVDRRGLVEVVSRIDLELLLRDCGEEGAVARVGIGAERHGQRAVATAIRRLAHLIALGLLEVGQQRLVAPAGIAGAFPAIEAELVTAD